MLFSVPLTRRTPKMAWNRHGKGDLIDSKAVGVVGGMHQQFVWVIASTSKFLVQNLKAGVDMQTSRSVGTIIGILQ